MDQAHPPNRLVEESSPYLLQHAYNPVDWHAWGEPALRASQEEDKPILLSVGYSACHWCHVMERESFEDPEIANLMNRLFINIKVDREERPDVDAIYMNYVQMTTGSGGWPLTVFLTPEQIPFFGGTYFPPQDHYGRPSFKRVLESAADAFQNRRAELTRLAPEIVSRLEQVSRFESPEGRLEPDTVDKAVAQLHSQFDSRYGGFGGAPKFPSAMNLSFLLRVNSTGQDARVREMVTLSLDRMAGGGLYDQLGGGFHRYSVDERWLVPHFEKMLYDNGLLAQLYLDAYQDLGESRYRRVVEETLDWTIREMSDPEGGYYSALDADSEGEEGKFYVWGLEQIQSELGAEESVEFCDFFDVTPSGNFEGTNILNQQFELKGFAGQAGRSTDDLQDYLDRCRQQLMTARDQRIRPGLDDKVLAGWNGLMLTATARAALVLDREDYLIRARAAATFLSEHMIHDGRLQRTWKAGRAKLNAYLEDYANVVEGLLALFEASGEPLWLSLAIELTDTQIDLFYDQDNGDFHFTSKDHEELLVRHKEVMDNATPSGNSTTCRNLLTLAEYAGRPEFHDMAIRMLGRMRVGMERHPGAFGNWLQAFFQATTPRVDIVLLGSVEDRASLLGPVRSTFLPNRLLLSLDAEAARQIGGPLLEGRIGTEPVAYVCRDHVCGPPARTADELMQQLDQVPGIGRPSS